MINVAISKEQGSHVEQFIEYLSKVRNLSENTLRSYQTDLWHLSSGVVGKVLR